MATTNILQFDLSRKVNGLNLGSTTLKNSYLGSNKVKEVYLGNNVLYINDHKKIQLTTPVSNAYISETPISAHESYINIDLRFNNSIAYTYINFLSTSNAYLTPTNYTLYTSTTNNTAKTTNMPTVTLYTTGYLSSSNEQNYYAYLDVRSDVNTTTILHRYHFKYHRLYSTGTTPSTQPSFDFNLWNISNNNSNCLYNFEFVFTNNSQTEYFSMFSGGGSNDTFEESSDTYKRFRHKTIQYTGDVLYLAYIKCLSAGVDFYFNTKSLSNISDLTSCTTNNKAANLIVNNSFAQKINISNIIGDGSMFRHVVNISSQYLYSIYNVTNYFVVDR